MITLVLLFINILKKLDQSICEGLLLRSSSAAHEECASSTSHNYNTDDSEEVCSHSTCEWKRSSLVSFILVVCVRTSLAIPLSSSATSSVALTSVVFTEYHCGAVTSLNLYVPTSSPCTLTLPFASVTTSVTAPSVSAGTYLYAPLESFTNVNASAAPSFLTSNPAFASVTLFSPYF